MELECTSAAEDALVFVCDGYPDPSPDGLHRNANATHIHLYDPVLPSHPTVRMLSGVQARAFGQTGLRTVDTYAIAKAYHSRMIVNVSRAVHPKFLLIQSANSSVCDCCG